MAKTFTVWLGKLDFCPNCEMEGWCNSFVEVDHALDNNQEVINTPLTNFFETSRFDEGYRLFAELPSGKRVEVKLGKNDCTSKVIRPGHNIERLLLGVAFGW